MKHVKRILVLVLIAALLLSSVAFGASAQFTDIKDTDTAMAAEVLRIMGVVEGTSEGYFRPDKSLTRAEFCKMAIYSMGKQSELAQYSSMTIFPDVKPSHWSYSCVNMSAKGLKIIAGYSDGTFKPDKAITAGEAVTILLRMIGYTDEAIGGVWPDSFMNKAQTIGMLSGTGIGTKDGHSTINRSQAARLFVKAISVDGPSGSSYYSLGSTTTLISVDGGTGTMVTADGSYKMVNPVSSTSLTGAKGKVVFAQGNKALSFIPESNAGTGIASAAIIIEADGSTTGLSTLAGTNSYKIYKNGVAATAADLKKYDVCTFSSALNAVLVSDVRITAYYEGCEPSPSAPASVTILGGNKFNVMNSAQDMLKKFKPGQVLCFLLTSDGQIAGVLSSGRGTAYGMVHNGQLQMFLGNGSVELKASGLGEFEDCLVNISSSKEGIELSKLSGNFSGDLDYKNSKLGSTALADNVKVYKDGVPADSQLLSSTVAEGKIQSVHSNWAGKIDCVVLKGDDANRFYGRVSMENGTAQVYNLKGNVPNENYGTDYNLSEGQYVGVSRAASSIDYTTGGAPSYGPMGYTKITELKKLSKVSKASVLSNSLVTVEGKTYEIAADACCYIPSTGKWLSLEAALLYSDSFNMYAEDSVIRILEVAD